MTNEQLLAVISQREQTEPFARGIITADRYVKTIQDVIGIDRCYRYMAKGQTSFDDLLRKAAKTLVYSNDEMELEEIYTKEANGNLSKLDLPKNTLMVFRHVLTSSKKDRDGDTLHSDGAVVDPKMLLLWQHVHTLPIGKMLLVTGQNNKKLEVVSCIVDMNDLCHDCAVMIDSKMGRFSHGFRALKFTQNKEGPTGVSAANGSGFDITSFEIMEESLVSVPANPEAETQEVLLSLVEGGKLTSPLMKEYGKSIRDNKNIVIQVPEIGGDKNENEPGSRSKEAGGTGGEGQNDTGTSEKADDSRKEDSEGQAGDKEMKCPECGKMVVPVDGVCPECEAEMAEEKKEPEEKKKEKEETKSIELDEKVGRIISRTNQQLITKAKEHVDDVCQNAINLHRGHGAQLREASSHLTAVLKTVEIEEEPKSRPTMFTVETASAHVIANANLEQRKFLIGILKTIENVERQDIVVQQYEGLFKAKKPALEL